MKNTQITKSIGHGFNKLGFAVKKHSPEILIVAGIIGTVTSTVMACKATLKLNDVLEESKGTIEKIHETTEKAKTDATLDYTEEDSKKNLTITYVKTAVNIAKLYAPAVALGMLSISSVITSNSILRKRNIALAAAYATVDKTFKEYRARVVEKFGNDVDREMRYGIKNEEIVEVVTDKKGKEKTVTKTVAVGNTDGYSDYARFFGPGNPYYENDSTYNMLTLRSQQQYANDLLRAKGFLTLNTVYEMLGFEETKAGMVVGWKYDPDNPVGDNYVDFGIFELHKEEAGKYEQGIMLDFNVDGTIYNLV